MSAIDEREIGDAELDRFAREVPTDIGRISGAFLMVLKDARRSRARLAQAREALGERVMEVADRMVAPGRAFSHVSASEGHEVRDAIFKARAALSPPVAPKPPTCAECGFVQLPDNSTGNVYVCDACSHEVCSNCSENDPRDSSRIVCRHCDATMPRPKPMTREDVEAALRRGAISAKELDAKLRDVFAPPSDELLLTDPGPKKER